LWEESIVTEKRSGGGVLGFLATVGLVEAVPERTSATVASTAHPTSPTYTGWVSLGSVLGERAASAASTHTLAPAVAVDPEVLEKLEAKLQKSCPPAYVAFMEQHENLRDVIPDEAMRLKAALKASHTTTAQMLDALTALLAVMDSAHAEFLRAFEDQKTKQRAAAEVALKEIDDQIAVQEEQLRTTQESLALLRGKRSSEAAGVQLAEQRTENVRVSFESARAQIVERLNAQKSHLGTSLG
jgi:hypothetical protein